MALGSDDTSSTTLMTTPQYSFSVSARQYTHISSIAGMALYFGNATQANYRGNAADLSGLWCFRGIDPVNTTILSFVIFF